MMTWEKFEEECTDFLNKRFGEYADFIHRGGSDSTHSDILVETRTGRSFYIEAKYSPAQCGQFVLCQYDGRQSFSYSDFNINHINKYAKMIIGYMNKNYDIYRDVDTAGKDIDMPDGSSVFAGWIIQVYKEKGVEFIITNDYTILPIDLLGDYFEVSATYRIKKSGSSNVGISSLKRVKQYITSLKYTITKIRDDGDKLFVVSPQELHGEHFNIEGTEYMFSLRRNEYEIRKLSNTRNANVIFSIKKKNNIPGMPYEKFAAYLKSSWNIKK